MFYITHFYQKHQFNMSWIMKTLSHSRLRLPNNHNSACFSQSTYRQISRSSDSKIESETVARSVTQLLYECTPTGYGMGVTIRLFQCMMWKRRWEEGGVCLWEFLCKKNAENSDLKLILKRFSLPPFLALFILDRCDLICNAMLCLLAN